MRDLPCCPHCGSPAFVPGQQLASPLDSLYEEVRRIREIAEARRDDTQAQVRVEELTREVNELRATVARLRGSALAGLARPTGRRVPAA
jgi:hypothetical protein